MLSIHIIFIQRYIHTKKQIIYSGRSRSGSSISMLCFLHSSQSFLPGFRRGHVSLGEGSGILGIIGGNEGGESGEGGEDDENGDSDKDGE
jgi:hypothetical protein